MFYGKRVLGEEGFAKEQQRRKDRRAKGSGLGKRVTGGLGSQKRKAAAEAKAALEDQKEKETDEELDEDSDDEEDDKETDDEDQDQGDDGKKEPGLEDDKDEGGEGGDEPAKTDKTKTPTLSIKDLEKALKANTSVPAFDKLLALELDRPEGAPRKGALRLFTEAEKRRKTPRKEVLTELARLTTVAE